MNSKGETYKEFIFSKKNSDSTVRVVILCYNMMDAFMEAEKVIGEDFENWEIMAWGEV